MPRRWMAALTMLAIAGAGCGKTPAALTQQVEARRLASDLRVQFSDLQLRSVPPRRTAIRRTLQAQSRCRSGQIQYENVTRVDPMRVVYQIFIDPP